MKAKVISISQCALLAVGTIAAQIFSQHSGPMAGIVAGGVSSIASVLGNLVANSFQKNEDSKKTLEDTLHNKHLAQAAADAVYQTLIAGPKDKDTFKLAERARSYWLSLQVSDAADPGFAGYAEKALPVRIIEYATDSASPNPIPAEAWRDFLIDAASAEPVISVEENQLNELASFLESGYPERLYNTFKSDRGAAFNGMVLRLLGKISVDLNTVQESAKLREDQRSALPAILDRIAEGVLRQADLADKLDANTAEVIAEVRSIQIRLHEKLDVIGEGVKKIERGVEEGNQSNAAVLRELADIKSKLPNSAADDKINILIKTAGKGEPPRKWKLSELRMLRDLAKEKSSTNCKLPKIAMKIITDAFHYRRWNLAGFGERAGSWTEIEVKELQWLRQSLK